MNLVQQQYLIFRMAFNSLQGENTLTYLLFKTVFYVRQCFIMFHLTTRRDCALAQGHIARNWQSCN